MSCGCLFCGFVGAAIGWGFGVEASWVVVFRLGVVSLAMGLGLVLYKWLGVGGWFRGARGFVFCVMCYGVVLGGVGGCVEVGFMFGVCCRFYVGFRLAYFVCAFPF